MRMNKRIFALIAIMAMTFAAGQTLFAQDAGNGDDLTQEVEAVNNDAGQDPTTLFARLSIDYNVDLTIIQGYYAQGYTPGDIWLALEVAKASGKTIDESLVLAAGQEGHGWGVLAQALGIKPGSTEFMALKQGFGLKGKKPAEGPKGGKGNDNGNENGNGGAGNGGNHGEGGNAGGNPNKGGKD
jgi:hypothetical protein